MYTQAEKKVDFIIEQKLKEKADIVQNIEISDAEFISALTNICILNQLRDANNGT